MLSGSEVSRGSPSVSKLHTGALILSAKGGHCPCLTQVYFHFQHTSRKYVLQLLSVLLITLG